MIINKSDALAALEMALSTGGDFAEVFAEDSRMTSLHMIANKMENALSGRDYGAGIRIFKGTNSVYVYTNDTSREGLVDAARKAAAAMGDAKALGIDIVLKNKTYKNINPVVIKPADVDIKLKAQKVREAHDAAKSYSDLISQVSVSYIQKRQRIQIANSEGLFADDYRTRIRLYTTAVASDGTENQTGTTGPGKQMGFEIFDEIDPECYGTDAARCAVTMLKADLCPAGKMPVAIENGFGGVIFHEACGHSLEATSVAKGQSVFCDMLGQKVASDVVTAIDDATIPNGWGSFNIDDEGEDSRKNVLIENGVLKSYLVDKLNGRRMGMPSTGSGRRQSYAYAPTSRMSNTYIAAGESSDSEIISSISEGLYCAQMGGGSVNPITGEFNFMVQEGYLIKNGKIDKPVRGATLIGKGSEVIKNIDMVGKDMKTGQGMCGSVSGSLPADVGQPLIRVSEITVGGRQEN